MRNLYNSREEVIKLCNDYPKTIAESKYKIKHGTELKILTPKQMLQRLPLALSKIKAGNNSESLIKRFRQSEKSKTFKHHVLKLKLTDKLDLKSSEKSIALLNLTISYTWKNKVIQQ